LSTLWKIDQTHSDVAFKIKHLMISTVTGKFESYSGSISQNNADDNFSDSVISFSADVNSISTSVPDRDKHLRSDDFFKVEKYPEMKFDSVSFEKVNN